MPLMIHDFYPVSPWLFIRLLLCLSALALFCCALDTTGTVSIDQYPGYDLQRQCAMGCIQNNYDNGRDLEGELGCSQNACYCETQYLADVISFVESCVSAYCATSGANALGYDISNALSIYNAYCNDNVGPIPETTPGAFMGLSTDTIAITTMATTVANSGRYRP